MLTGLDLTILILLTTLKSTIFFQNFVIKLNLRHCFAASSDASHSGVVNLVGSGVGRGAARDARASRFYAPRLLNISWFLISFGATYSLAENEFLSV